MMADTISRQAAIRFLKKMKDPSAKGDIVRFHNAIVDNIIVKLKSLPPAQPQKCSDILDELKADDYYNYIHTGYSRFSEDDWDYLIHNAKEKEKLHERLDKQAGGD